MKMFFVGGIGIAVFIEFLLIAKKKKTASDLVLSVWMFLILVHLFLLYINFTEDIYDFPFLLGVEQPLPLLQGVFLCLYVCFVTQQLPEKRNILLLHFVPAALMYLYLLTFFILPDDQKILVYRNHGAGYEVFMVVKRYAISLSGIFYVTWSALLLKSHRKNIRDQFSDLDKVNLRWLQILTLGMGGIWCLVIFVGDDTLIMAGIVIFIYLIGFFGVRQADIFRSSQAESDEMTEKKKYPKSGLTEEASRKLHQSLMQFMTEQAPYKNSELSIDDLSSKLGVHANYLSQVINQEEKKNFYDFINTYRIEEFKRMIAMPKNQQFTLLALAYDCGFSSKSSFNRYFKKATGKTPSEYSLMLAGDHPNLS